MQLPLKLPAARALTLTAARCWASFYLILFAAILIVQLFLPPGVGLANNGDFGRLTAGRGLTPNYPVEDRYFRFFAPDYLKAKPAANDRPGRFYTGSIAVRMAGWIGHFKPAGHFDLRWAGLVHMSIYLIDFGFFLFLLRNAPVLVKWLAPALAIWIFGDVFYAGYLNSLYLDAMGFLCFVAVVLAMAALTLWGEKLWAAMLFTAASMAFALSKPLNAPATAIFGAGVVLYVVLTQPAGGRRWTATAGVTSLLAGLLVTTATPHYYGVSGLVDAVMMRIAKLPDGPAQLRFFGLDATDVRFTGEDAFRNDGPGMDPGFQDRFAHTTTATLMNWYLRHPRETAGFLWSDLRESAPRLRPLGELEKQYSPAVRSSGFSSWSDLKTSLLEKAPVSMPMIYGLAFAIAGALLLVRRWRSDAAFACMLGAVAAAGVMQFIAGSLLDMIETSRHLFMFHVTTDILLVLLFCGGLWRLSALMR